jgi:hypothetical protein
MSGLFGLGGEGVYGGAVFVQDREQFAFSARQFGCPGGQFGCGADPEPGSGGAVSVRTRGRLSHGGGSYDLVAANTRAIMAAASPVSAAAGDGWFWAFIGGPPRVT